jgi:hypothetical protein
MRIRFADFRMSARLVVLGLAGLGIAACAVSTADDASSEAITAPATITPIRIPSQSVLTQHNDSARTGAFLNETHLTPAAVRAQGLTKQHAVQVDGDVFAQALVTGGGTVPFATNAQDATVYTVTTANKVYAIDAATGVARWPALTLADPKDDYGTGSACASLRASSDGIPADDEDAPAARCRPMGITETPVVDAATNTMYVVYGARNTNLGSAPLCWLPPPSDLLRGCVWHTSGQCPFGCDPTGQTAAPAPCKGSYYDNYFGGPSAQAFAPNMPRSYHDWWYGNLIEKPLSVEWYLAAIDLASGTVRGTSAPIGATVNGVTFDPRAQQPRPGMLLSGGHVYVGFGALSEFATAYHGWVLSYSTYPGLAYQAAYVSTPKVTQPYEGGGVWHAGGGIVGDANGNVYVATGSGKAGDGVNWADSIVGLNASLQPLATPYSPGSAACSPEGVCSYSDGCASNYPANLQPGVSNLTYGELLDYWDLDLGGGGLMLVNDGPARLLGGGKTGVFYLLNPSTLGEAQRPFRAFDDQWPWQQRTVGFKAGGAPFIEYTLGNAPHLHGAPVYWRAPDGQGRVFALSEKDRLNSFVYDRTTGTVGTAPAAVGDVLASPVLMPGGMLSLSANASSAGTGIVWATLPVNCPNGTPSTGTQCGMLLAYDAVTLDHLFSTNLSTAGGVMLSSPQWAPPTVSGGQVFLGTRSPPGSGVKAELQIFGLGASAATKLATTTIWSDQIDATGAGPTYDAFCVYPQTCALADVNGDGMSDLVAMSNDAAGAVWVALSNGWSFGPHELWVPGGFCVTGQTCELGDVNGDGMADLVAFTRGPGHGAYVAFSNGRSGFGAAQLWSTYFCLDGEVCKVADVTGDKKADLIAFQHGATGTGMWVAPSTGAGLAPAQEWSTYFCVAGETCAVADVDGDGKADPIALNPAPADWVALSTGSGLGPASIWGKVACPNDRTCQFADMTGDGKADLVYFHGLTTGTDAMTYVFPSTPASKTFGPQQWWSGAMCVAPQLCFVGDINGDHIADAVAAADNASGVPVWGAIAAP